MKNGKEPAFPIIGEAAGLTKREYIAVQIAIGLSVQAIAGSHNMPENMARDLPATAVLIADALLAELDKQK